MIETLKVMDFEDIKAISSSIGLLLFGGIFLAVVVWVFNPKNKKKHESHGQIPFHEDEKNG